MMKKPCFLVKLQWTCFSWFFASSSCCTVLAPQRQSELSWLSHPEMCNRKQLFQHSKITYNTRYIQRWIEDPLKILTLRKKYSLNIPPISHHNHISDWVLLKQTNKHYKQWYTVVVMMWMREWITERTKWVTWTKRKIRVYN